MYEYPFGAGQQLNLNWIISEIIQLHKQLDPDYVAPTFDNTFPFTNLNVLNLDWILKELKTIKDLAPTEDATLLKMVANALIAATYNPDNSYQENDIVYRDNERRIYVCINATTGAWVDADWVEIKIGDVLTTLLNISFNLSASAIANDSGVTGDTVEDALNNLVEDVKYETGYLKQKKNGTYSNVIAVEDTPSNNSDRLASSKAAYDLKDAINQKQDDITILSSEPANVACASSANTTLASFNLTAGTWIISGFHEWSASINASYVDNIIDATHNKARASLRNNSQLSGGGASLNAFVTLYENATINYITYNEDSESRTATNIRAIAFKIS